MEGICSVLAITSLRQCSNTQALGPPSWLCITHKRSHNPQEFDLIDLGWVSGKLSDDSKDYYSKVHWLVYVHQATFSVTLQTLSPSQSLFHSSFKPNVFASDGQITPNAICQLPDTSVSKLSVFLRVLFLDHG